MGEHSGIEWTHHTFNPWWGCIKISDGCQHCYAETLSNRFGENIWGPAKTTTRRTFGEKHWNDPLRWNRKAEAEGVRQRVFCGSMCDWAEDHPIADQEREKLWSLIRATPQLDWLLLTKRPERIASLLPADWGKGYGNVWLGTSVEHQSAADERIMPLLNVPACVHWLSMEPLLGSVEIKYWLQAKCLAPGILNGIAYTKSHGSRKLDWIIVGGESGPGARPMNPTWVRAILDQCKAAGTPFLFKQWGDWVDDGHLSEEDFRRFDDNGDFYHNAGHRFDKDCGMYRVGKKSAGRKLDGRTWDQYPDGQLKSN